MKKLILAATLLVAATGAMAEVGVSINIGQPGFYGRIDLGDFRSPPPVYVAEPVIIERRVVYDREPLYLRVPPGHRNKWSKHCSRYDACGRPVYFVKDEWYSNTYAPRYRQVHGGRDYDRRDDRRDYRDERRDYDRHDDDRGGKHKDKHGKGHGHGKHKD